MASNLEIVQTNAFLCTAIYDYDGFEKVTWDYLETTNPLSIYWGLKEYNGIQYFVFRGSATFLDWLRDFYAVANPFFEGPMGLVHPGFHIGTPEVYKQISTMITKPFSVGGHSKGAAEADNIVAEACLAGNPPLVRCVFGEPRPGDKRFGSVMKDVPSFSLFNQDTNGHDEITDVPFDIWPECYEHPSPLLWVSQSPPSHDAWGTFAYHHMQLYYAAAQNLTTLQLTHHHTVSTLRRTLYYTPATKEA